MNKQMEELSKPVAYKADDGSVFGPNDFAGGVDEMHHSATFEKMTPLYSQEYVSALLQRIAELEAGHQDAAKHIVSWRRIAKQNIAEREKDLAALEEAEQTLERECEKSRRVMSENHQQAQRIAELEAAEKVWESAAQKHIARAEAAEQRIAELEAKLATPVRLPAAAFLSVFYQCPRVISVDAASSAIRSAGFKVEGDA